jgi:hypothetical protein
VGGAYYYTIQVAGSALPARPSEAPALFAATAECPERGPAAKRRAHESLTTAELKYQRYPFAPRDGVIAVDLASVAEACFGASRDAPGVAEAARKRASMMQRIDDDYRLRRLRLDRAIGAGLLREMYVEAEVLKNLLEPRKGPFREWLIQLQRYCAVQMEKAQQAKK